MVNEFNILGEEFFTEAYYGKSNTLKECEDVLGNIITMLKANKFADINKTEYNNELCSLLKKQFGFKSVIIYWNSSNISNAATLVNSHVCGTILGKGNDVKSKNGYYDNTHTTKLDMIINTGIITRTNITAEELLAIILHEVGHNFEYSIYNVLGFTMDILSGISSNRLENVASKLLGEVISSDMLKDATMSVFTFPDRVIRSVRPLHVFFDNLGKTLLNAASYIGLVSAPIALPIVALTSILFSPIVSVLYFVPRKREEYADSFAAIYGYAVPLSTAFIKLFDGFPTDIKKATSDSEFLSILYDIGYCNNMLALNMEGHGSNEQRIKKMINVLESEINSSKLPREMKNDLMEEKNRLEKIYNNMMEMNDDERMVVTKTMRTVAYKSLNGFTDLQYNLLKMYSA